MPRWLLFWLPLTLAAPARSHARPIDPAIDDESGPFCYFSRPSTVLGVADGDEGTQVGPEGWLWTGSAQLLFFTGPDLQPRRQRIQTLKDGHLPIVTSVTRDGPISYTVTMFGATLDGRPESNLINFIRVRLRNEGHRPTTATFAVAMRAEGPHCCERLRRPWSLVSARCVLGPFYAARDDQLIYTFPTQPAPRRLILPDHEGDGPLSARDGQVTRETPVCMVRYDVRLAPGQEQSLDFTMPYLPVPLSDGETLAILRNARFDRYLAITERWWRRYLAQGMQIQLPERKVTDTYLAGLMYDSIARDRHGDDYVVTVNQFQYHYFWVRDGAYIINAFDLAGRHRWAEQGLDYYLKWQQADGIMYQPPQLDGWGQTLWAMGSHWRLTRDDAWARRMYPALARHVRGVFARIPEDPLGLVLAAPPYDNEAINGHYTGHSFWLIIGMRDMIAMAETLGFVDDAAQFRQWYEQYCANFARALDAATAKTGGYVPPGLDAENGCDWDNLLLLYPRGGVPATGALSPQDRRVNATVDAVRKHKYAEGIMTYGRGLTVGLLHHYDTIKCTHNLVALNRQRDALADFYSLLGHTSSTQAGFEFGVVPWDNRDPGGNFPPHGWFAAEYIGLLRNMLVREWAGDLHLLSVLSPAWMRPGSTVAVRKAPTDFGKISLKADFGPGRMTLRLDTRWHSAPRSLIVHLPWFLQGVMAWADEQPVAAEPAPYGEGLQIALPADTRLLTVRWRLCPLPQISYAATVDRWKREYRRRFAEYVRRGGKPEPLWLEGNLAMTAAERAERWVGIEEQFGIAFGCPASASVSEPGNVPAAAVDGSVDRSTYWGATPYPQWWQVDLGRPRKIDRIRVVTYWDEGENKRSYQYRVLTSEDGAQWQVVADESNNTQAATPAGREHVFSPVMARYVRIAMLHNSANIGVHLVEVMVFPAVEAPIAPAPAEWEAAWTAEQQTGVEVADMPVWGYVGAERIVLQGNKITRSGDRVRLEFRGGAQGGIAIGDVSIGITDPADPADIIPTSRTPVTFSGGANSAELPAGGAVLTDWISFPLQAGRSVTVTFNVLRTGATRLWSDRRTVRFESQHPGASRVARWSRIPNSDTYNLYFLSRVEVPR